MKYLKLFEATIKHSDPIAVNHSLKDFSRKVEDILIEISNFDNFRGSTVRRYFHDDESIHINYRSYTRGPALKIKMYSDKKDEVRMEIYCYKHFSKDEINTSLEFYNFVKLSLEEYAFDDRPFYVILDFPFSKLDYILETLESFTTTKKYNL